MNVRSYLPFVLDTTTVFLLIFVMVTQIILPLLADLPVFWLFSKHKRSMVNRYFLSWMGREVKKKPGKKNMGGRGQYTPPVDIAETLWCEKCQAQHRVDKVHKGK